MQLLPNTRVVWSCILPRRGYRYSLLKISEKCRNRINRFMIEFATQHGGKAIKYPDFQDRYPGLFRKDEVHLSNIGNDLFLNALQGAFDTFLSSNCFALVYPVD